MDDFFDDINNILFDYDGNGKVNFWDDALRESQRKHKSGYHSSYSSSNNTLYSNYSDVSDETEYEEAVPSKTQQKEEMLEKIRSRRAEITAHIVENSADTVEENEPKEEHGIEQETETTAEFSETYCDDSELSAAQSDTESKTTPVTLDCPDADLNTYTKEEYKSKRGNMLVEIAIAVFAALLVGAIPGGLGIGLFINSVKDNSLGSTAIFVLLLLAFAGWLMYKVAGEEIKKTMSSYNNYVEKYEKHKQSLEKTKRSKKTNDASHVNAISIIIPVFLVLLIVGVCFLPTIFGKNFLYTNNDKMNKEYGTAVEMALGDEYAQAIEVFEKLNNQSRNFKDSSGFIDFCRAKKAYYGDGQLLTFYLEFIKEYEFKYVTKQQKQQIRDFIALAQVKSDELSEKSKKNIEAVESASSKNAVGSVNYPYVNLPESELKNCILETTGIYDKKIADNSNGYTVYEYSYNGKVCYRVTCFGGIVIKFDDYLHETTTVKRYSGSSGSTTKKRSYYYEEDDYDVDEYADAEEFYYWHEDDFADYEDAEEYYNDNY